MMTPVTVGVVGLGDRGLTLARAFQDLAGAEVRWLADHSPQALLSVQRRCAGARATRDVDELLADESLDAVVVATPLATRSPLVRRVLDAGKHAFVDVPMAFSGAEADELVRRADAAGQRLHSSDDVLHHPGLAELRRVIASGRLGDLCYFNIARCSLDAGRGEGAVWSMGAAAVAMVLWLVADEPVEVSAAGGSMTGADAPQFVFCRLRFATGIETQMALSSLEPLQARRLTVVGSAGTAVFDELDPQRSLTLCERTAAGPGDTVAPRLPAHDALAARCEHFVSTLRRPSYSHAAARETAGVVGVLEALHRSLERGGTTESIGGVAELIGLDAADDHRPLASVVTLPLR
jgi:predicted dehydrogenase